MADERSPPAVEHRSVVSHNDLIYDRPAETPDAGHPIGNGRMSTMVWTSPDAIHLQIYRVHVFAVTCQHDGRRGQRGSATDYCGGTASVAIQVGGEPFAPAESTFRQRLSLANAECTIESAGVLARTFISAPSDVLVMEIDDQRPSPQPLQVVAVRNACKAPRGRYVTKQHNFAH